MAHVQISLGDKSASTLKLVVDGVDLSDHVFTEGFGLVRVGDDPLYEAWGVSMILAADSLDIDLPDAVIQAIVKSDEEMSA
jgi:hypothetical protein